jgi:hypothetical protein
MSGQKQKLFQPSAAGYGTRVAGLSVPEGKKYSSRASLIAAASPMGHGGRMEDHGDTSFVSTPGSSNTSTDYFGKGGHSRGQSSGIKLPGATAATSRKGLVAHPFLPGASIAPDGSGFLLGQVTSHSPEGPGPSGYASRPAGLSPSERSPGPRTSNVGMGSPPASDARRKSKYTRADGRRVDSVGPGTIRKSMYLGPDGQPSSDGVPRSVSGNNNLRRVDSVGRGDHRRKSTFVSDAARENRGQSIYNNGEGASIGKGGSARDPLAARRPMMPSSGGSNTGYQPRGIGSQAAYEQQQQQKQQREASQYMNMPPMQRQVSPMQQQPPHPQQTGMPPVQRQVSPLPSQNGLSRPIQPIRGFSGYSAGGYGPPPMGGNYDMKTRQVV